MLWSDLHRLLAGSISSGNSAFANERPIVFIDSKKQCLHLADKKSKGKVYRVSTSIKGLGNLVDSQKTPTGVHRIKQKIGGGLPWGMVFKSREPTGRICDLDDIRENDEITSRILWLDGLEAGINQGGDCDSYGRYIYIHGTSDEKHIGQPASIGCIRMTNDDVIELFDRILVNDLVIIR